MKYRIVTRISGNRQEDEQQVKYCLDYIEQHDRSAFEYKIYQDQISATKRKLANRPGISLALKELEPGDILVALRIDRLARRAPEIYYIKETIESLRCGVVIVRQNIHDTMALGVYAALAQKETENISDRVKERFSMKRKRNERISRHLPYGWMLDTVNLVPIKRRDGEGYEMKAGKLIECPAEQIVLKEMLRLVDDPNHSFEMISRELNDRGYRNRQERPWSGSQCYRILGRIGRNRSADPPQRPSKMALFPGSR